MSRPPAWFLVCLAACAAGVFVLARATAQTFPYPWNDEARFFLPSLEFARTGSLRPTIVHAPEGIFWTPHGFYVALGLVLRVFGSAYHGGIGMARTANQVVMAAAAAGVVLANAWWARSWKVGALSGLLLISPPVILAANEVRMEALVSLLYAVALLLVARGWRVAAVAVLLLSLLVHPALMFALFAVVAVLVWEGLRGVWPRSARKDGADVPLLRPAAEAAAVAARAGRAAAAVRWAEWVLLGLVVSAVLLEAGFVVHHWALFREHMSYQSARKLHRGMVAALAKPQGVLLVAEAGIAALVAARWLRANEAARAGGPPLSTAPGTARGTDLLFAAAMALGLQLYAVLGAEFSYDVYSLALTPATFFAIAYRLATDRDALHAGVPATEPVSVASSRQDVGPELVAAAFLADS